MFVTQQCGMSAAHAKEWRQRWGQAHCNSAELEPNMVRVFRENIRLGCPPWNTMQRENTGMGRGGEDSTCNLCLQEWSTVVSGLATTL